MRSVLGVVLLLAACALPAGAAVPECDGSWREVESVIVTPAAGDTRVAAIECMRRIDRNRVRIGFEMPPGPACFSLAAVDVVEAADAVSFTLTVAADDDPTAGACPEQPRRTATEVDLQAPVADRALLDGGSAR
jgi:hypothetical protein